MSETLVFIFVTLLILLARILGVMLGSIHFALCIKWVVRRIFDIPITFRRAFLAAFVANLVATLVIYIYLLIVDTPSWRMLGLLTLTSLGYVYGRLIHHPIYGPIGTAKGSLVAFIIGLIHLLIVVIIIAYFYFFPHSVSIADYPK